MSAAKKIKSKEKIRETFKLKSVKLKSVKGKSIKVKASSKTKAKTNRLKGLRRDTKIDTDPRLNIFREATENMLAGSFPKHLPTAPMDDIGQLGKALEKLSVNLEERFRNLTGLIHISEKVNESLILDEVLNHIYETFQDLVPFDRLSFAVIEKGADGKEVVKSQWAKSKYPLLKIKKGFWAPLKGSSLEKIIETKRPRIINDLVEYAKSCPQSFSTPLAVEEGIRSSLTCPIIASGRSLGFMFFSSNDSNVYKSVHVDIFLLIAGQLANIFEKSRLYQELLELNVWRNQILGMAAHDLRAPLANIVSSLDVVLDEKNVQWGLLEVAQRSAFKMEELINNFLETSLVNSGKIKINPIDINIQKFLIETIGNFSMILKPNNIFLSLERKDSVQTLKFDISRMSQALGNLISNAVKFSPANSVIKITTEVIDGFFEFTVEDQGVGIKPDELKIIFDDFKSGSNIALRGDKSTGLGLFIVKKILEAHGGNIKVQSIEKVGTKFTLQLPLQVP
jgi:signal transduction histidine kinase